MNSSLHPLCSQRLVVSSLLLRFLLLVVQHLRKFLLTLNVPRRDRLASFLARRWVSPEARVLVQVPRRLVEYRERGGVLLLRRRSGEAWWLALLLLLLVELRSLLELSLLLLELALPSNSKPTESTGGACA